MELQTYSLGYIDNNKAIEVFEKVKHLATIGDFGAPKYAVADYFEVSEKTLNRILKEHHSEFLQYGDYRINWKELKDFVRDKSVPYKVSRKTRKLNLFNRKHVLLFACYLNHTSEVAKQIVHYLIQVESSVSMETKIDALLSSLVHWDSLPSECRSSIYMQTINELRKARGLVAFAESVGESASLVSINDFAKATYRTLELGRNKLFREMRLNGILNHKNRPYHCYIKSGYFQVVTRVINCKVIHQPMLTGKGEVWLLPKMKKILGI